MAIIFDCLAPAQDPMFGISHESIVPRLTLKNWRNRATLRETKEGWLYIYVVQGTRDVPGAGRRSVSYLVEVHGQSGHQDDLELYLENLEDALAYANGEDGGKLAQVSSPMTGAVLPPESGPEMIVGPVIRPDKESLEWARTHPITPEESRRTSQELRRDEELLAQENRTLNKKQPRRKGRTR